MDHRLTLPIPAFPAGDWGNYVKAASQALLETGVTAYLPTFITTPEEQLLAAMSEVPRERMRPRILGMHLEGPFLSPSRLGTHGAEGRLDPDVALLDRLLDAGPVRLMTLAPDGRTMTINFSDKLHGTDSSFVAERQ